jgi:hypothetical protein
MQILLFKWNKPLTQILLSQKSHKKNKKKFKKISLIILAPDHIRI